MGPSASLGYDLESELDDIARRHGLRAGAPMKPLPRVALELIDCSIEQRDKMYQNYSLFEYVTKANDHSMDGATAAKMGIEQLREDAIDDMLEVANIVKVLASQRLLAPRPKDPFNASHGRQSLSIGKGRIFPAASQSAQLEEQLPSMLVTDALDVADMGTIWRWLEVLVNVEAGCASPTKAVRVRVLVDELISSLEVDLWVHRSKTHLSQAATVSGGRCTRIGKAADLVLSLFRERKVVGSRSWKRLASIVAILCQSGDLEMAGVVNELGGRVSRMNRPSQVNFLQGIRSRDLSLALIDYSLVHLSRGALSLTPTLRSKEPSWDKFKTVYTRFEADDPELHGELLILFMNRIAGMGDSLEAEEVVRHLPEVGIWRQHVKVMKCILRR